MSVKQQRFCLHTKAENTYGKQDVVPAICLGYCLLYKKNDTKVPSDQSQLTTNNSDTYSLG